jgi:alpha-tubulin suppressor-like RCC1 family protein
LLVASVVKNVTLTSPRTQVLVGDTVLLKATAFDYNNAPIARRFTWTSSNNNVATVDTLGRAIFKTTGSATFTATTAFRSSSTPAPITASPRQLLTVSSGGDFTCGLAPLGRGYCWGLNSVGQLAPLAGGLDSTCVNDALLRATPVTYAAPSAGGTGPCRLAPMQMARPEVAFAQISAGGAFACGVTTDQSLYCWGDGAAGQCGNGKLACGATPQLATVKTEKFLAVSAGGAHACAVAATRLGYCWGADSVGQLGDTLKVDTIPPDKGVNSTTPVPVRDRSGAFPTFSAISAGGRHSCGITTAGTALCWGDGGSGQLGDGVQDTSDVAIPAAGAPTLSAISAGGRHTCGLSLLGAALCWGDNTFGQLGTGIIGGVQATPVQVSGGLTFLAISAGERHTCAVATGGTLYCWGNNAYAQLGNGAFGGSTPIAVPSPVAGPIRFSAVTAGRRHTCGIGLDSQTYCWGANLFGSLGDELQAAMRETPQRVATPR